MASRMDRYYQKEERSQKNKDLYKQIREKANYTNIEGVADISNSNEINISMVKEMLLNRENYQRSKDYHTLVSEDSLIEEQEDDESIEEKNYDIRDILNKAKIDHSDSDIKYRNLKNTQYDDILKRIKIDTPEEEEELKELIQTITLGGQASDDLGIFDELKSNTMVGDASSIKQIINDAKALEEVKEKDNIINSNTTKVDNIDKSFYTSSFNFSDKDFEDLRNLDSSIKRNNKLMKTLIIIFGVLIALVIIFAIIKFIF